MINAYHFYKLARFMYLNRIPLFPRLIKLLIFLIYNSSIPFEAEIGKGTRFAYSGIGVVLHKRTKIGKNCNIGTNVTIGGRSGHHEVPSIGDGVYLATGSKVLGPIKIGENSIVGANSVVIKDVPKNSVVAGVPAKVIRNND